LSPSTDDNETAKGRSGQSALFASLYSELGRRKGSQPIGEIFGRGENPHGAARRRLEQVAKVRGKGRLLPLQRFQPRGPGRG
jgi:hypothetical protein